MIWTITIKLVSGRWAENDWGATVALEAASTLEDVHDVIQQAVEFDRDHLYGFFVARTSRSRDRVRYDGEDDDGQADDTLFTTTLESLFPLPRDRKLFYLFDYGDSWLFEISRTRKKPFEAASDEHYPCLISERGDKPQQYPESDFGI